MSERVGETVLLVDGQRGCCGRRVLLVDGRRAECFQDLAPALCIAQGSLPGLKA
nr:hypothetical protein [Thermobifida fusca]